MTPRLMMAAVATFTFAAHGIAQAAIVQPPVSAARIGTLTQAAVTADDLSGNLRGFPVLSRDGTQIGVLRSAEINNFGHAQLFIDTRGNDTVLFGNKVLILTAGTHLVTVGARSVQIDVITERMINNIPREFFNGRYVNATILN